MSLKNPGRLWRGAEIDPTDVPRWFLSTLGALLFLGAWYLASEYDILSDFLLPTPGEVLGEFLRITRVILNNLWVTVLESVVGFVVAVVLALLLGLFITMNQRAREALMPLIIGGNSVPRIAVAPLIIFYFGGGAVAKYIIAAWIAFFPMLINTVEGLSLEDDDRKQMLELFDTTVWQEYRFVRIPHALPHIFDGMKLAVALAIIGAIVGEFVAANKGLGALVVWALWNHNIALALAIVLVMGALGVSAIVGLYMLQNRVVFWRDATIFGGDR